MVFIKVEPIPGKNYNKTETILWIILLKTKGAIVCLEYEAKIPRLNLNLEDTSGAKILKGSERKLRYLENQTFFILGKKIAVFIDGCFWHKCPKCFVKPKSKNRYWDKKIRNNVGRDKEINLKLKKRGITVVRFWEHNIKRNIDKCYSKLKKIYEKKANNN